MDLDINLIRSVFTVVSLCIFVAIMVWAYSRTNKVEFEEAARLSLAED
jgi:cytochrome c oxidase cbb3-type subunit 4